MTSRTSSLQLLVVGIVSGLVLGSLGTAVAAPALTQGKVRSLAAKVVAKAAPHLSVRTAETSQTAVMALSATSAGNATNLDGQPASAYRTAAYRYQLPGGVAAASRIYTFSGLPAGSYTVTFTGLFTVVPSGTVVTCRFSADSAPTTPAAFYANGSSPGASPSTCGGSGVVSLIPAAPPALTITGVGGDFRVHDDPGFPSTVIFSRVDSLTQATAGVGP